MSPVEVCPVCGDPRASFLFSITDRLHQVPGQYIYVRCANCGTVYQNPRVSLDDLGLCYPTEYFTHTASATPVFRDSPMWNRLRALVLGAELPRRPSLLAVAFLLRRLPPVADRARLGLPPPIGMPGSSGTRALEIGPGQGLDLLRLRRLGWDPVGLDVDAGAAGAASRLAGCPVFVGDMVHLLSEAEAEYGLVYSSHSLEHLPDPLRSLGVVFNGLRAGGRLVMVFPNCQSLVCRLFGKDAVSWDPPRHLTLPTPKAITEALESLGYTDVRVRTAAKRAAHYGSISSSYRRGIVGPTSWAQPIQPKHRLLAFFERCLSAVGLNVGEEIIVAARKPDENFLA